MRGDKENKEHKQKLEKTGKIKCGICKPNKGENSKRKAKPDKYKNHRMHMAPDGVSVVVPTFPGGGGPMGGKGA